VVTEAMDRDTWLSAQEALEFGLVDKVFETRPEGDGADAGAKE
jgi:ATP-dependent Clp protease, protease subunit